MEERRLHRSSIPVEAVRLQLLTCESEFGLESLVLADARGMVLAASRAGTELADILAAFAPLLDEEPDMEAKTKIATTIITHSPESRGKQLKVRRFEIQGEGLYICGLALPEAPVEVAFERVVSGVCRIVDEQVGVGPE